MNQDPKPATPSEGAQRILDVATVLFAEAGPDAVSIARIAREAGVGKATIFHHFPSKEALYHAVLWQVSETVFWLIEDQAWRDAPLIECMAGFIRQQIRFLEDGDELLRLVRRELIQSSSEGVALMSDIFSGPFFRLREHLEYRMKTGELDADTDTGLLAWMLMDAAVYFHEGRRVLSRLPGMEVGKDPDIFSQRMARLLACGCTGANQDTRFEDKQ